MLAYVLTDEFGSTNRNDLEYIASEPATIKALDKLNADSIDLAELDSRLLLLFRKNRANYEPTQTKNFIKSLCPQANELIGLHRILHGLITFKESPVYLQRVNL